MNKDKTIFFLIHGFSSTYRDMLPIAEALEAQNYKTSLMHIAGHDCSEEEFMNTSWIDWLESTENEYKKLVAQGYDVIPVGHSMGGDFALYLGQHYKVPAVISISAPLYLNRFYPYEIMSYSLFLLRIGRYFIKKIERNKVRFKKKVEYEGLYYYPPQLAEISRGMKSVKKNMHLLTAPLLILHAFDDQTVLDSNPMAVAKSSNSSNKYLCMYTVSRPQSSKHTITMEEETKKLVIRDIFNFIESL